MELARISRGLLHADHILGYGFGCDSYGGAESHGIGSKEILVVAVLQDIGVPGSAERATVIG